MARSRKSGPLGDIVKKVDKTLGDAMDLGKIASSEAGKAGRDLTGRVDTETKKLRGEGQKRIKQGMSAARNVTGIAERDLSTLERLHGLKDAGVLTEEEFLEQKRKILDRI